MSQRYSCMYRNLTNYNDSESSAGRFDIGVNAPIPSGVPSMRVQTVPVYGGPSYDALTHENRCGCGGHFNIVDAYPHYKNNCTKFTKRLCSDDIKKS